MIKVLVHYKQWVDSGNVHFDDTLEDRSKIVEVKDLLELNDMFRHITKIEVINNLTIPVVNYCKPTYKDKNRLPEDIKYLFHKGVYLYQTIMNYEQAIIGPDEFVAKMREIEKAYCS